MLALVLLAAAANWAAAAAVVAAVIAALASIYVASRSHRRTRELEREKHEWQLDRARWAQGQEAQRERDLSQREAKAERERRERESAAERRARTELRRERETELTRYQELLCRELRDLRILDMAKPLDLRDLYVNLRVRDDARTRFPREDERAVGEHGDPLVILERAHAELLESAASALSPEDALERFSRIVVVGDPGAGKTTMLRHLALTAAGGEARVPIYVELKDFVDSGEEALLDFIHGQCAERYRFASAPAQLAPLLEEGKAVLLLDGLDETLGGATAEEARAAYARVVAQVELLAVRYPDTAVALTCRRAGWEGGLEAFRVLEVLDFSDQQVSDFVGRWFAEDAALREALLVALELNARMRSLAANPLLLSLICIVFERDLELPERRAELYNRCVEVLLSEWDSHRGIKRFSQFTTDRKRDLLEEVAWHFHSLGARYFPEDELLQQIAAYLPTIDIDSAKAAEVLSEVAAQYGLLKQQAQGMYGFLHLTLQEYFAAVAANERGPTAVELVAIQVHQPWWEEVGLLLAGRMSDASSFLAAVLRNPDVQMVPGTSLAPEDNVLRQDLLFAARCLIGTPRVKRPGLREAIVAEVAELVATGDIPPVLEEAAAFLGQLEDPAILRRSLSAAVWQGEPGAGAIVRGLSRVPSSHLAAGLVPLLEEPGRFTSRATRERALQTVVRADPSKGEEIQRAYLRSGDPELVRAAAETLAGSVPEALLPDLAAALSVDSGAMGAVAHALEDTSYAAAVEPLLDVIRSSSGFGFHLELRQVVRTAIVLGGDDVLADLARMLDGANDNVTFDLLAGMAAHPGEAACASAFSIAIDETSSESLRWGAVDLLAKSREHGEVRVRDVLAMTSAPAIRAATSAALVRWGDAAGIPTVRAALLDPEIRGHLRVKDEGHGFIYLSYRTKCLSGALREVGDRAAEPQLMEQYMRAIGDWDLTEAWDLAEALNDVGGGSGKSLAEPLLGRMTHHMLTNVWAEPLIERVLDERSAPVVLGHVRRAGPSIALAALVRRIAEVGRPQAIEDDLLALHRAAPLGSDHWEHTAAALAILAKRLQRRLSS